MVHIIPNLKSAIHHSKHESYFKLKRIHLCQDAFDIIIITIHVRIFLIVFISF